MNLLIKRGTKCMLSEPGYYNFYYPSDKFVNTVRDSNVEKLNWIKFTELVPVKLPKVALESEFFSNYNVDDSIGFVAVWIKKDALISVDD